MTVVGRVGGKLTHRRPPSRRPDNLDQRIDVGFPYSHTEPQAAARILGLQLMSNGKLGFVAAEFLLPTVFDQLCYIKDASGWKIADYNGTN